VVSDVNGLAATFGGFAAGLTARALPESVLERGRLVILHNLAVALAGWGPPLPGLDLVRRAPEDPDGATLLVDGRRVAPLDAAFANGCLMHIRTQDDFYSGANAHLGAVIIPAVLAAAECSGASGEELVAAVVAGYEVMAAVGAGFSEYTTPRGFRSTSIFGPLGAAAGTGRVLRLPPDRLGHAIAISASLAGGLTQPWVEGTSEWAVEVGSAGRNGFLAAQLAAQGMAGAANALEGPRGFYHAFAGERAALDRNQLRLGERWRILENTFKRLPISGISQVPVRTALELRRLHSLSAPAIERVDVFVNDFELHYPAVDNPGPFGGPGAALMSLQYCVATALQTGTVRWRDLLDTRDDERLALCGRVILHGEPERPPLSARVVVTAGGRRFEAASESGAGLHFDRQAAVELVTSLQDEMPIPPEQVQALVEEALAIDRAPGVKRLLECCVRG
jgi:2-methylcitrate dehydratase PrpD